MSANPSTAVPGGAARDGGPKRARPGSPRLRTDGLSAEARRQAAASAGVRTPAEAAQQLAISLTRYYIIEGRALHGLAAACEPRPPGKRRTPEGELAVLRRECEQLRRQAARQQALLRVTERTLGLAAAPAAPGAKGGPKGPKKRRPRKPKARALQAAAALQGAVAPSTDNGLSS